MSQRRVKTESSKNSLLAVFVIIVIAAILAIAGLTHAQNQPNYRYPYAYVPARLLIQPMPYWSWNVQPQVAPRGPLALYRSPVNFSVNVAPIFPRTSVNFHDNQWTTAFQKTRVKGDVSIAIPEMVHATYSITTGVSTDDAFTPVNALKIGETDFKKVDSNSNVGAEIANNQTSQTKPVAIEYREALSHQLSLTGLVNYPIKPCIILEWPAFTITGTGEVNGKTITDTETFRRTFYGLGASFELITQNVMSVECLIAASNNYVFVQGAAKYRLRQNVDLVFGGIHKEFRGDGLRIRTSAPFVGLTANF